MCFCTDAWTVSRVSSATVPLVIKMNIHNERPARGRTAPSARVEATVCVGGVSVIKQKRDRVTTAPSASVTMNTVRSTRINNVQVNLQHLFPFSALSILPTSCAPYS